MSIIVKYVLLSIAIALIVAALILRLFKLKTIGSLCEISGLAFFIAFTSQYAPLITRLSSLSEADVAHLLLFIFSIVLGVYRFLYRFIFIKR